MSAARAKPAASPDRRLAPRPLPAHLAGAAMLWLSSRAGLRWSNAALPRSNAAAARLRALADEIAEFGRGRVAQALDGEIERRALACLAGLEAYRRHAYRRPASRRPVVWRDGTTRLIDYGGGRTGPAVVVVPSLVNRYYILDLLPGRSFLRHLAAAGLRPLVVDWGEPGEAERGFALDDYIRRLDAACAVAAEAGQKLGLVGYCMGGLLALAAALRQQRVACLALLATPWDFHADPAQPRQLAPVTAGLDWLCADRVLPVDVIQFLFFALDPFLAQRKFIRFAALDPAGDEARHFVALEDWINDGVPLAAGVARQCLEGWYRDNRPARGAWAVAGEAVRPEAFARPALVVLPGRDRIVPPGSAARLADRFAEATVLRAPLGHVGMMAGARAPALLWQPIGEWLRARLRGR